MTSGDDIVGQVPEVVGAAVEVLAQLSSMTLEAESCFPEEFREQKLSEMRQDIREEIHLLLLYNLYYSTRYLRCIITLSYITFY